MSIQELSVELLPARTVLTVVANGGWGGEGGDAEAGVAVSVASGNINFGGGSQIVGSSADASAAGGSANGGDAAAVGDDAISAGDDVTYAGDDLNESDGKDKGHHDGKGDGKKK